MIKRSHQNNLSLLIISHDNYELPKSSIRCSSYIYHIFKPNTFRDVQNLYHDKASMYMTPNELKFLTSTCGNKKYQPLRIDMSKDKYTGCCRIGLNSLFVPNTTPF